MTLTIQRADLARTLAAAVKATESRNTIPILGNVLLSATAGTLTVTATDLDIMVSAMSPCDGEISTTVDAKRLSDIARRLSGDVVTLDTKDDKLVVKSGRSRFTLPTLAAEDFPRLDSSVFDAEFKIDLASLVAPVKFAMSSEPMRYYLCGVYVHEEGETLRAVATDGHRLSHNSVPRPDAAPIPGVIIPSKTVGLIPHGTIDVGVSKSKIRFATADTVIVSKLIDGTYPDYKRVIPQGNDKQLTVNRKDMASAVSRVASIASERSRAAKFSVAGDNIAISMTSDEGAAQEDVHATYSAEPLDIGFNSAYVGDVLGALTGDEISLSLGDPGSPALFKGTGEGQIVLMPMRV